MAAARKIAEHCAGHGAKVGVAQSVINASRPGARNVGVAVARQLRQADPTPRKVEQPQLGEFVTDSQLDTAR